MEEPWVNLQGVLLVPVKKNDNNKGQRQGLGNFIKQI